MFDVTPSKISSKKKRCRRLPMSMDGRRQACIEFAELNHDMYIAYRIQYI